MALWLILAAMIGYLLWGVCASLFIIADYGRKMRQGYTAAWIHKSAREDVRDMWIWPWYLVRWVLVGMFGNLYTGFKGLFQDFK